MLEVLGEDDGIGGVAMKEEEGGSSSENRRPYDPSKSITAEWATLQPDLVQLIADSILSTSGIEEYMGMRAVCPSWRSAVSKPSPHTAVADLRFRPRQLVLLDRADDDEGRPLFLDVTTGRFRRLHRPVLRDYIFVGASDGLLVLGDREPPHAARLFNPLTGDMFPFAASIPPEPLVHAAIAGSEPTIIFSFPPKHGEYEEIPAYCSLQAIAHKPPCDAVYSANPTGQLRPVKFHDAALNEQGLFYLRSMVTYAGNVYVLSAGGTLCKILPTGGHWYAERMLEIDMHYTGGLMEAFGKLLLVKEESETIEVFNVDVKREVLEPIESIGSSALFINYGKCVVVDADKLPSIERNCIYSTFIDRLYVWYVLSDGKKKCITSPHVPGAFASENDIIHEGPLSLAEVLLTPYPEVKDQLDRILHEKKLNSLASDFLSRWKELRNAKIGSLLGTSC